MNGLVTADLHKRLEQAWVAWRAWRHKARTANEEQLREDPFAGRREISSRATFQSLQNLPKEVPERDSLLRWVAALTLDRVTFEDVIDVEVARRVAEHPVRSLGAKPLTVRDLCVESTLASDAERRAIAAQALIVACDDASSNSLFWLARRQEAARQLGLEGLTWLEASLSQEASIPRVAELVLKATQSCAQELMGGSTGWQESLHLGTGREATEGWPAQLSGRWVYQLLKPTGLVEGIQSELDAFPEARNGSSFLRALQRFGVAAFRARARERVGTFALALRPFDPKPYCLGALFASLLLTPAYLRKHLGMGQARAQNQARALARSAVANARVQALQAALSTCDDVHRAREVHVDLGGRALCATLPSELAGVLPRYRPSACARFLGTLQAAVLREHLVQRHDEDWFDNPRAQQELREIDVLDHSAWGLKDCENGVEALQRALAEVLG